MTLGDDARHKIRGELTVLLTGIDTLARANVGYEVDLDEMRQATRRVADLLEPEGKGPAGRQEQVPGGVRGRRILCIDDDARSSALLRALFEEAGATVEMLGADPDPPMAQRHDLVIVDWHLGEGTSQEFIGALRACDGRQPAVLVLTGDVGVESVALAAGADAVAFKPLEIDALLGQAGACLARRHGATAARRPPAPTWGRRRADRTDASGKQPDLLGISTDIIARSLPDGTFIYVSPACVAVLGYEPEEMEGRRADEFFHPEDTERELMQDTEAAAPFIHRYRAKDGSYVWFETVVRAIVDELGDVVEVQSSSRDITLRRQVERALAEGQERFRTAFGLLPLGMAIVGLDGRFLWANAAMCALTGHHESELLRRRASDVIHPDDVASHDERVRRLLRGETDVWQVERRNIRKSGETIWVLVTGTLVRDEESKPLHFVIQVQDITERRAEVERTRAARTEAEQANQAKTEFVARMSHELRTPLNSVLGFAQLLIRNKALPAEVSDQAQHILAAGRHLLEVINDLLDIQQMESGEPGLSFALVDLDLVIEEAVAMTVPMADARGVLLSASPSQLSLETDGLRLRQIVLNLLSNAVKYSSAGDRVVVRSEKSDDAVHVVVEDTGIGIPSDALQRIFAPLERMPEALGIEGTGLGLTVSQALATALGGGIDVESVVGEGSRFTIVLPARTAPVPDAVPPPSVSRAIGTVLHVEDNPMNRVLVREVLTGREGLRLLEAPDCATAQAIMRAEHLDLLLLDLDLPDGNGEVLLDALADNDQGTVPVVVVSAHASPAARARLSKRGVEEFLTKPIDTDILLAVVDAHLDQRPA